MKGIKTNYSSSIKDGVHTIIIKTTRGNSNITVGVGTIEWIDGNGFVFLPSKNVVLNSRDMQWIALKMNRMTKAIELVGKIA